MDILRELGATLLKMFAADLWLSLSALAAVVLVATALQMRLLPPTAAPFVLATGVLAALTLGVIHSARR